MKNSKFLFAILTFIISFFTTIMIKSFINVVYKNNLNKFNGITRYNKVEKNNEINENSSKTYNDETLDLPQTIIEDNVNYDELKKQVDDYIYENKINDIGITFYDLNNEKGFSINGDTEYFPASISKLYSVITLYDYAYQNKLNINGSYSYNESDYENGSGVLQNMDLTNSYTLLTLSDYAIVYSDNIAYRMINRIVGKKNIKENYESIIGHETNNVTFNVSPNDAFKMLQRVYYNENNNELYSRLINNMKNTIYEDRIAKYLPKDIVAHKIGNYNTYIHDIGIVYDDMTPYILCVFTNNVNDAYNKIADISKLIYDYVIQE